MKRFLAVLCFLVIIMGIVTPVKALNASSEDNRGYINVSYSAEKEVAPDTVQVSIAIKTESVKSMEEAVKNNKEISDKVYSYLKSSINSDNNDYIKTSNYSARPNYIYKDGKKLFDKYEVSNNIILHTKSLDKVSSMIDKSLSLGATDVNSLNFSLSDKDAICEDLLIKAAQTTNSRAKKVAASIGANLDGIKHLDTSCSVNYPSNSGYYQRNMLMMSASGGGSSASVQSDSAPIEAGLMKVYSTVNASYFVK